MSTPVPAATILMVRDAPKGLEVLMVERHQRIEFASGALVFPGGKANAEDAAEAWVAHADAPAPGPEQALMIAAVREAFEESGLLIARKAAARGAGKPLAAASDIAPLLPLREAINAGAASFLNAVAEAGLVLALDEVAAFAHWITPEGLPKRFDTHFFIAKAPGGQIELCDGAEAVEACWIAPHAALEAAQQGRRRVMFPTRMNLELLGRTGDARAALAAARERAILTVTPRILNEDGALWLAIPPEAGYAISRARFEPGRD